jgi:orotate phosphoribosyltransferase-like protein
MFSSASADILTDASGDATVYLTHSVNRKLNGFLVMLKYTPGTLATGADLTITGETSGVPILTITNAGTSAVFYYPRALGNAVADGAAGTTSTVFIPIKDERIKVVVAQGGNAGAGSIEATLMTDPPY